jgi:CRP/FNR family transcriptional regulator
VGSEDLRAFPLFSHISDADVINLGGELQLRTYAPRQRVFGMGEPAVGLYFIKSGKVKVFRVSREGSEQVLGVFGDGEEFALAAVFHGGCYPATAETLEPSRIYFLERDALLRHIQREPELALRLLNSMSKKLQSLVSLIDSLSLKDARGRLARYLSTLLPPDSEAPATVDLPMSKTLLSQHLGVKMETLSRTFRVLVNDGTLGSIKQGHIEILDIEAIHRAAGDEPE